MSLLAVIPARKNSQGIPGKALRTVAGVPMILRTLRTVEQAEIAERIVVSTDCPEIRSLCRLRGYRVIERPARLARADTPLLSVARHVAQHEGWTGSLGIFQPTCPLLSPKTLQSLAAMWERSTPQLQWAITATEDRHIAWRNDRVIGKRVNRQLRDPLWRESGAAQFMTAEFLRAAKGKRGLLSISTREALDIDTPDDLLLAECLATRARIHFVVAMGRAVGSGHFHRSFALARALGHHDLSWEWLGDPTQQARESLERLEMWQEKDCPTDMVIFDCLQVPEQQLLAAKKSAKLVVLEDDTEASKRYADLLVNELLDPDDLQYAVLREEFLYLPSRTHPNTGRQVVVTFGGSDPAGLGERCARVLAGIPCEARVIDSTMKVQMAQELRAADVCLTGHGRTVLEAAVCGTPCISMAANEREARHVRLPGVTYLGLHSTVTDDTLRQAVDTTLRSKELREEKAATAKTAIDGRGLDRLVRRIEDLLI